MNLVKIITLDKATLKWKSLKAKLNAIETVLNTAKNADFKVEIEYRNLTPKVVNGRIDRAWFKNNVVFGFADFFVLHMNMDQKTKWGVEPTLRGLQFGDGDDIGDMYIWADETTKRKANKALKLIQEETAQRWFDEGAFKTYKEALARAKKTVDLNQFVETTLHEIRHEICFGIRREDDTHFLHNKYGTITPQFEQLDMANYQKLRQVKKKVLRDLLINFINSFRAYQQFPTDLRPLVKRKADTLVQTMAASGMPIRIVEGVRSCEVQEKYYAKGRTLPGKIVTNARCGDSFHQYGVAFDVVFTKVGYNATDAQWKNLGAVGKALGFEWGGDWKFKDMPHFQLTLGYSIDDFKQNRVDYSKWN